MAASMATMPPALKDVVIAILSVAARRGSTKVPLKIVYEAFADAAEALPGVFAGVGFTRTPHYVYSKPLDSAIQEWVGYGIDVTNPELQYLEVTPEAAERHLTRLERRYGRAFLDVLSPGVDRFVEQLNSGESTL